MLAPIVAAFLFATYTMSPPDNLGVGQLPPFAASIPMTCARILGVLSFVLTIADALFAALALRWADSLSQPHQILNTSRDGTRTPESGIRCAVSMIVIIGHLSLFLFLAGLVLFLFLMDKSVAIAALVVVGLIVVVYSIITICSCTNHD
jgi:hypothetical protein